MLRRQESEPLLLVMEGELRGVSSAEHFRWWSESGRLTQFWPKEAEIDGRVGGYFRYGWPDSYLHGHVTAWEPGSRLGFTWTWNYELGVYEPLNVLMRFSDTEGGSFLRIEHGPFTLEDAGSMASIQEGWEHFFTKLVQITGALKS